MRTTKVTPLKSRPIKYIVLHYTVSSNDNPLRCYNYWDNVKASADFVIGRKGNIAGFKSFKNNYAWHYGDPTWGGSFNKESIGFEIESYGPLDYCASTGKFLDTYKHEIPKSEVALTRTYRGHNIWHYHTDVQISATANLILALYNSGAIDDKTQFIKGATGNNRYNILFPETGLTKKPTSGIVTHGTGRPPSGKIDTFPQFALLEMLDDLPALASTYSKTSINWQAS